MFSLPCLLAIFTFIFALIKHVIFICYITPIYPHYGARCICVTQKVQARFISHQHDVGSQRAQTLPISTVAGILYKKVIPLGSKGPLIDFSEHPSMIPPRASYASQLTKTQMETWWCQWVFPPYIMSMVECISSHVLECIKISRGKNKKQKLLGQNLSF